MNADNFIENYSHILDLLDVHTIITDDNAKILYANPAALANTGFSQKEVLGKNPSDLWGGNMSEEFYQKMWKTIKIDKKKFVSEIRNVHKDGSESWQEIHITPILDEKDNIELFVAVEIPIQDKKLEESKMNVLWKSFIERETRISELKTNIERMKKDPQ